MASIFISHAREDQSFARQLATDLQALGHEVWLDEWEIRVGESIPLAIERAVTDADFVVVVLSEASCSSPWVEREWKAKYWVEVERNTVMVLPALLQECEIPGLLKPKLYADFRTNYAQGIVALSKRLGNPGRARFDEVIAAVSFLVNNLVSDWEFGHLEKVHSGLDSKPESRYYIEEIGRLCALKFLELKPDRRLRDMKPDDNICSFVQITRKGRQYLDLRSELNVRSEGLFTAT